MSKQIFANNASAELASIISESDTLLPVTAEKNIPAISGGEYFLATLYSTADPDHIEIVKVTGVTLGQWTIEREQEGTTALSHASGSPVELRLTAGFLANAHTDLSVSRSATSVTVESSNGENVTLLPASTTEAGLMSAADKQSLGNKQDALVSGTDIKTINGESVLGNGDIKVSVTADPTSKYLLSSNGTGYAFSSGDPVSILMERVDDTSFIVVYLSSTGIKARLGKVQTNGSITYGAERLITLLSSASHIRGGYLFKSKFRANTFYFGNRYRFIKMVVNPTNFTISSTESTWSVMTGDSASVGYPLVFRELDSSKVLVVGKGGSYMSACLITLDSNGVYHYDSGTTTLVSSASSGVFWIRGTDNPYIAMCLGADASSAKSPRIYYLDCSSGSSVTSGMSGSVYLPTAMSNIQVADMISISNESRTLLLHEEYDGTNPGAVMISTGFVDTDQDIQAAITLTQCLSAGTRTSFTPVNAAYSSKYTRVSWFQDVGIAMLHGGVFRALYNYEPVLELRDFNGGVISNPLRLGVTHNTSSMSSVMTQCMQVLTLSEEHIVVAVKDYNTGLGVATCIQVGGI